MNFLNSPRFLRAVLWADALSAAGTAMLQMLAPAWLAPWLGLQSSLLFASGVLLWLFVAGALWLATRAMPPRAGLQALAVANGAWVAGCAWLLLTGAAGTAWGVAYLVLQALAVGGLAELQWMATRRPSLHPGQGGSRMDPGSSPG